MRKLNLPGGSDRRGRRRQLATVGLIALLGACSSLGGSGPTSRAIEKAGASQVANADIKVVDVTDAVARQVLSANRQLQFSETFGDVEPIGSIIGRGDVLEPLQV